jgi:hypothetical protein
MAVFQIGSTNIPSGAERHGAAQDPPDRVTSASVQLVDTDGLWGTTVGNIQAWGVQQSNLDGTFNNDGSDVYLAGPQAVAFGTLSRNGQMPMLFIRSFDGDGNPAPIAPPGVKLRLAIQVDHTIRLGATIKTNADAV